MFNRASSFIVLALPLLAAATAVPRTDNPPPPSSTCNTGPIQCCNSVQSSTSPAVKSLAGLLGIVLPIDPVLVGLTCTPITVIGGGGNSCSSQPVCCSNNEYNGVINIGCTPININL